MKFLRRHHVFFILGALVLLFAFFSISGNLFTPFWMFAGERLLLIPGIGILLLIIGLLDWSYARYIKEIPVEMSPDKVICNYVWGFILLLGGLLFTGHLLWTVIFTFVYIFPSAARFLFLIGPVISLIMAHISERLIWWNRGQPYFTPVRIS